MKDFLWGLNKGLPIGLGYLSVSFAFGLSAVNSGLTTWQATLISLTNLTSAGQVAGLSLMIANASFLEMATAQFIINIRYSLMSISLSQNIDKSMTKLHRFITSAGITDEVFVVASLHKNKISNKFMYGLILLPYIGWGTGTFLGAIIGRLLPYIIISSLGIAIYAMFLAIIVPPAKKSKPILLVVIISATLSCIIKWLPFLQIISGGFSLIISTIIASVIVAILFPIKEKN